MKSIHRFLALFSALLLATTTGCIDFQFDLEFLTFVNPSVTPEDAEVQVELFGSYIVTEVSEARTQIVEDLEMDFDSVEEKDSKLQSRIMHVGRAGKGFPDGFLRCVEVSIDLEGKLGVKDFGDPYFASKVGDCYILNVPFEKAKKLDEEEFDGDLFQDDEDVEARVTQWKPENYEGYLLVLLKPTKTGFAMHFLDEDFIKAEITAGRLEGKFMTHQQKNEYKQKRKATKRKGKDADVEWTPFVVSAKPAELQAFFGEDIEKITGDPFMFLKRVK